jgi:PBP1b-binding outer membrane lipoprotein LpoB
MKTVNLSIIALAAAMLAGCSFGDTNDEPVTADPVPVTTSTANPTTTTAAPGSAKPQETIQVSGAHIDASAFLNALVDSGCQIDNAEYKEVKRGGAIKVVCAKSVDALNVELEDL